MRRNRPIGIGAIQKDRQRLELFEKKGSDLAKEELKKLTGQMAEFRTNLEKFAGKYKNNIKKNAEFRRHFQQMCASAGVDPLRSSANFWVKLLGVGDFYYELAIQVVEVFLSTGHKNGGIMSIEELLSRVLASKNIDPRANSITTWDILEAIKKLKVLGSHIREVPTHNSFIIHATPAELNSDQTHITQVAHSNRGYVSQTLLREKLSWSDERIQKALDELIMEGIIWIDKQGLNGEYLYWFAGLLL